jgi:hypothetical protein
MFAARSLPAAGRDPLSPSKARLSSTEFNGADRAVRAPFLLRNVRTGIPQELLLLAFIAEL